MNNMTTTEAISIMELYMPYESQPRNYHMLELALAAMKEKAEREQRCNVVYRHRHAGGYKYTECPECGRTIETDKPYEGDYPYCGGCGGIIFDASQPFCCWCGCKLGEVQGDE